MTPPPLKISSRDLPLTRFQGIVLAAITFFLLLALSIPLTIGQRNLQEAQEKLAQADAAVCNGRQQIVDEHNELAQKMATLERSDPGHSAAQREAIASAWEDSLLTPVTC